MKKKCKGYHREIVKLLAVSAATGLVIGNCGVCVMAEGYQNLEFVMGKPAPLAELSLPKREDGYYYWGNENYIPTEDEYCDLYFVPNEKDKYSEDPAYDEELGAVCMQVSVSVQESEEESPSEEENTEEGTDDVESTESEEIGEAEEIKETEETIEDTVEETVEEDVQPEESFNEAEEAIEEEVSDVEETLESEKVEEEKTTDVELEENIIEEEPVVTELTQEKSDTEVEVVEETKNPYFGAFEEEAETEENVTTETVEDVEKEVQEETKNPYFEDFIVEEAPAEENSEKEELSEAEKQAIGEMNHTSGGIYVSGDLPWYVQFQVNAGDNYTFSSADSAEIFQSYEFELWDTLNETEYHIPEGGFVTVSLPAQEGYDYIIEHILDNGAVETIIPYMEGDTLVFQTRSFSPFAVAGSEILVGDISSSGTQTQDTAQSAAQNKVPSSTSATTSNTTQNATGNVGTNSTANTTTSNTTTSNTTTSNTTTSNTTVNMAQNISVNTSANTTQNTSTNTNANTAQNQAVNTGEDTVQNTAGNTSLNQTQSTPQNTAQTTVRNTTQNQVSAANQANIAKPVQTADATPLYFWSSVITSAGAAIVAAGNKLRRRK